MTYLTLNIIFITLVLISLKLVKIPTARKWHLALIPLLVITAIFDPLMIHLGFFNYTDATILGWKFFGAPVEDFMYPLLAMILVPSVWEHLHNRRVSHD